MDAPASHRVLSCSMVLRNKLSELLISRTSLSLSLEDHSGSFCYQKYIEYRLPCNFLCLRREFRLFRFRSPLLTESLMIYFPGATWMFRFTPCPTNPYIKPCGSIFKIGYPDKIGMDCSIRKPPDQRFVAPPRRVSPPYASFLGQNLPGIHYRPYE